MRVKPHVAVEYFKVDFKMDFKMDFKVD